MGALLVALLCGSSPPSSRFIVGSAAVLAATFAGFVVLGWVGGRRRLTRIACQPDGRWSLCEAGGQTRLAELAASSRISSQGVWLAWNGRRHKPLLLLKSDLPASDFRRLLVRLRVAPFPKDESQDAL